MIALLCFADITPLEDMIWRGFCPAGVSSIVLETFGKVAQAAKRQRDDTSRNE